MMTTTTTRSAFAAPAVIDRLLMNLSPARTKLFCVTIVTAASSRPSVWPATRSSCQVGNVTAGLVNGAGRYHYIRYITLAAGLKNVHHTDRKMRHKEFDTGGTARLELDRLVCPRGSHCSQLTHKRVMTSITRERQTEKQGVPVPCLSYTSVST